jgi:hypothetical protein
MLNDAGASPKFALTIRMGVSFPNESFVIKVSDLFNMLVSFMGADRGCVLRPVIRFPTVVRGMRITELLGKGLFGRVYEGIEISPPFV